MEGCEHTEASPIGKCAICDRTVCSDCYRSIFNGMICDLHQALEDESDWALVGLYTSENALDERRPRSRSRRLRTWLPICRVIASCWKRTARI